MALDNPSYFTVEGQQTNYSPKLGNMFEKMENFTGFVNSKNQVGSQAMRALLRSVSSNSADSNQELFVLGEPRLSDMAPEFAMKTFKGEPKRSNSLKTKSEMHNGVKYAALATDEIMVDTDDDEIFLTGESARYYNTSAIDRRRHSIGTFMARDRSSVASSSKSFKDDRPQAIGSDITDNSEASGLGIIDEHSLRHASYPRKRCTRCTGGTIRKTSDMDDILIISFKNSQTPTSWVNYFISYFEQERGKQLYRKPFKMQHLGIEDIEANGDVRYVAEKTACVKLQLVVICPNFLEHVSLYPEPASALGKILLPDRTLALLLGVTEDDIKEEHKRVFPTYSHWQRLAVGQDQDQDESFTKEFLTIAMSIFLKVWKQQSSVISQDKAQFSVFPKKLRQGQSSFIIMLTYPLQKEDVIKVSIERNNELTEIKSIKCRNPYALKVNVPDVLTEISAIIHVLVEKNGSIIGSRPIKCESKLRELEQILRSVTSPVEFMCQTLGFNPQNKEQLDNYLVHALQKNIPPNFNLLNGHLNLNGNLDQKYGMSQEFPTLLHFAAKFGLENLAIQLLDCPGGDLACEIRNNNETNPSEIASAAGHINLSHILKGYMKMNEFTSIYTKLKEISQVNDKPQEEYLHYLSPKSINDCYKICPPPRPVTSITPSPTTEYPSSPLYDYMAMNSSVHMKHEIVNEKLTIPKNKSSQESINIQSRTTSPLPHSHNQKNVKPKDLPIAEDKFQKELLEIINDFKNNVHSIAQAEKLVEEWKNRNDVQKSFKEKQDQLNELRNMYEKVQQEMKRHNKQTPIERIKKLFPWFKHKDEDRKYEVSSPTADGLVANTRPISSLSLQSTSSSGSSGRISTISGCSMGDSGTHSDHEERKITTPIDDDFRNELNKRIGQNYMIPPPPKAIKSPTINKCPTIDERPPQPVPRPESDQYYIHVPPSGLPVHNVNDSIKPTTDSEYLDLDINPHKTQLQFTSKEEYMNVPSTLQPSSESMSNSHHYMNVRI